MLRYYVKKSYAEELQIVPTPAFEHTWVYGASTTDAELAQVVDDYSLDENIVHDVNDKHELPRVEYTGDALYVFASTPQKSLHGSIVSVPFLSVLKGSVLITLAKTEYFTPEDVFDHAKMSLKSSHHVFVQVLNRVIKQYEDQIHRSGTYILNTRQRLKSREVDNKDFIEFVTVEGDLNEYKTRLSALLVVFERLHENRHKSFTSKDCELIEDIILHVNQLLVAVASHTQTINSIRNAYTTITNNTLNRRMKTLTLLTVLITLPNVFYGMYGMNVALPFAEQEWAYLGIIGFTVILVVAVYMIVHRLKF